MWPAVSHTHHSWTYPTLSYLEILPSLSPPVHVQPVHDRVVDHPERGAEAEEQQHEPGVRRHLAWRVRLLLGLPHPAAAPAAAPLSAGGASAIARMDLSDLVSPPAARPHRQRADSSYLEEAMRTAIDVRDEEIKRIEGEKREVLQGCKEAKALLMLSLIHI